MNACDNPFDGSYELRLSDARTVAYSARGECGMGGPTRGTLRIDGTQIAFEALPSFCFDAESSRFAYFQIEFAGPPRVTLIVTDARGRDCFRESLNFGAYSVKFLNSSRLFVRDEYTQGSRETEIPDASQTA